MSTDERQALASQLTAVLDENARLTEENARLKTRLQAQIAEATKAQRRVKELEAARRLVDDTPTYVTVDDKECTGGSRDIIVIR